ncbi:MAG: hypothetical protein GX200_05930 [Firmicutes bacterium]|nr:hypothetical protein [Bacillota bacterium]
MEFTVIAAFIIVVAALALLQNLFHRQKIKARIISLGGTVLRVEKKKVGPFAGIRKSETIYKFLYEKDGKVFAGWVRFGFFPTAEWQLVCKERYEVPATDRTLIKEGQTAIIRYWYASLGNYEIN